MKKLYRVWDKELEIVEVLNEHNLCEGATVETYLCRGKNGKFVCSKDMYFETELEAWIDYYDGIKEGIKYNQMEIDKIKKLVDGWFEEMKIVKNKINTLSPKKINNEG